MNALGIDFGTDTIKICDRKNRITVCEKNMIAVRDGGHVIAIGDAAYDMYEKTPANVRAGCPMTRGVIAEIRNAEIVLMHLMRKNRRFFAGKPAVYIAVPRDISAVEKRAYYNVLNGMIHARKIFLVDKGIADTVGVGVPMDSPRASMLVNIGAGTTEISVAAGGRIVISKTMPLGGANLDDDIVTMVRRMYHLNIGRKTAAALKNRLAYLIDGPADSMIVTGVSTISGLPDSAEVTSMAVSYAISAVIERIMEELRGIIDRLPSQFHSDIIEAGLCLTGGTSLIPNFSDYLRRSLQIPISMVREPGLTTLRGIQFIMNRPELADCVYSLKDLTGNTI